MQVIDVDKENQLIAKEYKELLKISYQSLTRDDKKLIRLAFDTAVDAHKDQRRKSGIPYVLHPIAVAKIVASEIGLDATSICAALLHDVVEDSSYTLNDLQQLFGETIAKIVDGLTKISNLKKDKDVSLQAENFRKMLLTLNDDIRVIIIKIADRLHNMQTMDAMPEYKQVKIASETLYIYAPLAHRIGLYNIKTELEDLGLKYTEKDVYTDLSNRVAQTEEEQKEYIADFSERIEESLQSEKIKYEIKGRPKSIYSIRNKMVIKNISFDQVFDKFAIRIVYKSREKDEKFLAWKIYSIVTDHYRPNPLRLRDWISSPKTTGYEALHITVMGPKGRWVEVQIRSERMHEIAEKGYAAHFKYKQGNKDEKGLEIWLNRLQDALENPQQNAVDFVEEFKLNLYSTEIFVFTPDGDLKSLPTGSTPIDFAFSIHTEIGMHTRGAKVNGKIVPLSRTLKSGDQVEIITSEKSRPTANWLDYSQTGRARSKIRSSLSAEKKLLAEEGKEQLRRKLKQLKFKLDEKTINDLVVYFGLNTSLDLYYRVQIGTIDNVKLKKFAASKGNRFLNFFKSRPQEKKIVEQIHREEITANYDQLVFTKNEERLDYSFSNCCNPIPGDEVFGFITVNEGIKVHKKQCPNALSLQSKFAYRIVSAKWIDSSQENFVVDLKITGIDYVGMVNEITQIISNNLNVNIKKMAFSTEDGTFTGDLSIEVKNKTFLKRLMKNIENIGGVEKVVRD